MHLIFNRALVGKGCASAPARPVEISFCEFKFSESELCSYHISSPSLLSAILHLFEKLSTMISPTARTNRRDQTAALRLLFFASKHFVLGSVFLAGVLIGTILEKGDSIYESIPSHHDFAASPPVQRRQLSNNRVTGGDDGWKTINVFYGSNDDFESLLPNDQRFFSQARQDEVVLSLLRNKTKGYFVDLASNDATILSNSYALERHYGWKGLCIEPNPAYWYNLTHARKNCELVGAVVGRNRMDQVNFKFNGLEHGGIVGDDFDNGPRFKSSSSNEYTVTLSEIFKKFDVPRVIDYLSLDVEGAEEFIMTSFPLEEYRIRIMTIERPKQKLRTYLESHGYLEILRLSRWGETLWIHGSFQEGMDLTHLQEFHGKKQYQEQKAREVKAQKLRSIS